MLEFHEAPPAPPPRAILVWSGCCAAIAVPGLLVWAVRGVAAVAGCAPGPQVCHGFNLGQAFNAALDLAAVQPSRPLVLFALAFAAAIAALFARRVVLGTVTIMVLPVVAQILPMLAVLSVAHPGCPLDDGGSGNCALWGTNLNLTFDLAANTTDLAYGLAPYTIACALLLGVLGWLFTRPKPRRERLAATMHVPKRNIGE